MSAGTPAASILILDGGAMSSLAFIRSLGAAGVRVRVAASSPDAIGRYSRFCARFDTYPSPLDDREAFGQWLRDTLAHDPPDVLLGCTDATIPLLMEWREALSRHCLVPLPPAEGFAMAFDKGRTLEVARQVGVHVPAEWNATDADAVAQVVARDRWPVVVKPRSSVEGQGDVRVATGVTYAFNAGELAQQVQRASATGRAPLVQEYIHGAGVGCFYLFHGGEVVARFQHRRLRDKNPLGSGSCLRVSVPLDPALVDGGERLLRAMGWEGLAMVEYRQDSQGVGWLMEINPRPWGSMQLAVEAGVDFPLLWWQCVTGREVESPRPYRVGLQCRYLVGDFSHLEAVLRGRPKGWRLDFPGRARTVRDFLRFSGDDVRYDDFAADDPSPGWHAVRRHLSEVVRRLAGRLAR